MNEKTKTTSPAGPLDSTSVTANGDPWLWHMAARCMPAGNFGRYPFIVLLLLAIGLADYVTGTEIRLFPFYFIPVAIAAARFGRRVALVTAVSAALLWVLVTYESGLHYSEPWIWIWNTAIQALAFWIVAELVAQLHAARQRESSLARVDRLTGLLNRRAFLEQAPQLMALCRRHQWPLTLAFIDLDHFKELNDSLGHRRGDEALSEIADIMRARLRASDLISRIGGDEFAVMLPSLDAGEAGVILERLRAGIEQRMRAMGCAVTASIGAINCAHPSAPIEQAMEEADRVMYIAKRAGKNRIELCVTCGPQEAVSPEPMPAAG